MRNLDANSSFRGVAMIADPLRIEMTFIIKCLTKFIIKSLTLAIKGKLKFDFEIWLSYQNDLMIFY